MRLFALFFCLLYFFPHCVCSQPLLQPGKRTVFQRVVSNPNAILYEDQNAQTPLTKPRTFTSFYVYAREAEMIQVGVSTTEPQGWFK